MYISDASRDFPEEELRDIAQQAGRNNVRQGITGALLFIHNSFIQVIEGRDTDIRVLLDTLEKDARHRNIRVILDRYVEHRGFEHWSMGLVTASELDSFQVIQEIDLVCSASADTNKNTMIFPESQTFVMMQRVYETNASLQRARGGL
jgi:hypothetical protein